MTILLSAVLCIPAAAQLFSANLTEMRKEAAQQPKLDGAPVELSCETEPGGRLCRKADYLDELFDYTCTGVACTALWKMQSEGLKEVYDLHGEVAKPGLKVEKKMGEKFKTLAGEICRTELTGAESSMWQLVFSINLAMPKFKDLQERAGIEKPRHCTFQ